MTKITQSTTVQEDLQAALAKVRKTEDGKFSVLDVIKVAGQQKSHREVWKRLQKQYPDIVTICDSVKLTRTDGKIANLSTPVSDAKGILEIIGLLPGILGKKYRKESAEVMYKYFTNPGDLASQLMDNAKSQEQAEDITAKVMNKYIKTYHPLMKTMQDRGAVKDTFMTVNFNNTVTILGATPREIKKQRGGITARKNMNVDEAVSMAFLQEMQSRKLDKVNAKGHTQIIGTTSDVASKLAMLIDDCTVNTIDA